MSLRIVPLGGLGEIGLNAMVLESAGRRLLVDCGLLFPKLERGLGFDAFVPDLSYLRARPGALDAVVITHGHEDHLGAVPLLLRELHVPVYAPRFALRLLEARLREMRLEADLRVLTAGERMAVGPFEVEPIHVSHSIPDAVGLAVRGAFGCVVHTGDFKLDPTPVDGRPTDLEAFARAGDEGVTCLLSDSTNAERAGATPSEREVGRTLRALIQDAPGRVVVGMFASHLPRLQGLIDLCAELGRKIVVHGRGMVDNLRLGRELGHLRGGHEVVVDAEQLNRLSPREVVLVTTGAQGEPRAGLSRMAFDPDAPVRARPGDLVIFSARAIPGNEPAIHALVNRLWELGATVVTDETFEGGHVHASGHASREEQREMILRVRPQTFVPIHGEARQLARHVRTARESGIAPQCLLARDGDVIELDVPGSAQVVGTVPVGRVALVRRSGAILGEAVLRERAALAEGGLVAVSLVVERSTGQVLRGPELSGLGLSGADAAALQNAAAEVQEELRGLVAAARTDRAALEGACARGVARSFRRDGERRPTVLPVVLEL